MRIYLGNRRKKILYYLRKIFYYFSMKFLNIRFSKRNLMIFSKDDFHNLHLTLYNCDRIKLYEVQKPIDGVIYLYLALYKSDRVPLDGVRKMTFRTKKADFVIGLISFNFMQK